MKHIAREISILFDNNPDAVEMMKKSVEVSFEMITNVGSVFMCVHYAFLGCSESEQTRFQLMSKLHANHQRVSISTAAKSLTPNTNYKYQEVSQVDYHTSAPCLPKFYSEGCYVSKYLLHTLESVKP